MNAGRSSDLAAINNYYGLCSDYNYILCQSSCLHIYISMFCYCLLFISLKNKRIKENELTVVFIFGGSASCVLKHCKNLHIQFENTVNAHQHSCIFLQFQQNKQNLMSSNVNLPIFFWVFLSLTVSIKLLVKLFLQCVWVDFLELQCVIILYYYLSYMYNATPCKSYWILKKHPGQVKV